MKVVVCSLEAVVDEDTGKILWVPNPSEEFEGEPEEVLREMIRQSDTADTSVDEYIDGVRVYLREMHEIDLGPIAGQTERDVALNYFNELARHGLIEILEE